MATGAHGNVEAGFAKLHGEDFEYYMQTYSIILGRDSKESAVDVDLHRLGGGNNISNHHARIFYDFSRRQFSLEVLGRSGCLLEGVLLLPGNSPKKLYSQDFLQIGEKKFYFLLPAKRVLGGQLGPRHDHVPHSSEGERSADVPRQCTHYMAFSTAESSSNRSRAKVKNGRV